MVNLPVSIVMENKRDYEYFYFGNNKFEQIEIIHVPLLL